MFSLALISDVLVLNDIINQAAARGSADHPSRRTSRKFSQYLSSAGAAEDEEGPRLKERLSEAMYKAIDIFCVWDCCNAYVKLSEVRTSVHAWMESYDKQRVYMV